ncbi:MAG: metallophosphoesterase family protein, partial [archaeon GB-1867-035]|nr:metallophosphoesterase family protein [Candidatus Culexmicrobium profundum]
GVFRKVVDRGVHYFLRFDGRVLLSSVMPDELIVSGDVFDLFVRAAVAGCFDGVIGWDVPVYFDMPLYYSWVNLVKGLELTYRLCELDVPVIALVKGNTPNQIRFSLDTLERIGFRNYGLHASEYLQRFRFDARSRNILYRYADELGGRVDNLLVIGALRPDSLKFIHEIFSSVRNLSVCGLSYYLDARDYRLYLRGRVMNVSRKFLRCSCPGCGGVGGRRLLEDLELRVRHNLVQLKCLADGGTMYEGELYDLVVGEGERAVFVSDLHIWTVESRFERFLQFLGECRPDHLVLLGDVFDFRFGRPSIQPVKAFFNAVRRVGCTVHLVGGCCDGDVNSFLRALDKLAFQNVPPSLIYTAKKNEPGGIDVRSKVLLDFYRFYRLVKDELMVKLPDDSVLLAFHGHKLVENPREKLEVARKLMTEYRVFRGVDWLVMGHIHRAFIDYDNGLAGTGCWQIPPRHLEGVVSKDDLFRAVLVDGDGNVKLIGVSLGSI